MSQRDSTSSDELSEEEPRFSPPAPRPEPEIITPDELEELAGELLRERGRVVPGTNMDAEALSRLLVSHTFQSV